TATLVKQDDAIGGRIEEAPIVRAAAATGAAMEKHDRFAVWLAALFVVQRMDVRNRQQAAVIRLDWRVQARHSSAAPNRALQQASLPTTSVTSSAGGGSHGTASQAWATAAAAGDK